MMLTGQVFAILSGTAKEQQIRAITASADRYLYDPAAGGYRLNTNFQEEKYDMGRMFGFAYGEKENGAVFSHMTVMYANALYKNGFVQEGYRALQTLADTALDFATSRIYPGIPEYFNAEGRGMYHYLTGAASWYMLTMVTEVFGVCGKEGDLCICPKLVAQQFDEEGHAAIRLFFAGKQFVVDYHNPGHKEYGEYRIKKGICGETELFPDESGRITVDRDTITRLTDGVYHITVELE
jgi:cellobiose phosphorylase